MATTLTGNLPERTRRAADQRVRIADQLVDVLVHHGVTLALGLPGGAISAMFDALIERSLRQVHVRHENTAVFAAAAYARQRGAPAAVLLTSGPGILNATTALASAWADSSPMIVLVGEVARPHQGRIVLQDGSAQGLDLANTLRSVSKQVLTVTEPTAAVSVLRHALALTTHGRPGPVVVVLPVDVLLAAQPTQHVLDVAPSAPVLPHEAAITSVTAALERSRRIVILAGSGCRAGQGPARLRQLAEHLGAPVVTTPKAKGVLSERHPLHRGVLGIGGHTSADALFDEPVETLMALGTSMGDLATHGWAPALRPTRDLIQVDVDPMRLSRSYATTVALPYTVEAFLDGLLPRLGTPRAQPTAPQGPQHHHALPPGASGLHPGAAVRAIQAGMPRDTVFTVDSGEHCFFAIHHLVIDRPDGFLAMLGLGSMGSGICGALGAQLAHPDRPVACICGDGGMLMCLGEVTTAVQHGLPIVWFVFHDGRLGMVEHGHRALYGRSPGFEIGHVDFAAAARAMGARGATVYHLDQLRALDLRGAGPLVVDIHIDGSVQMPKGARLAVLGET